MIKEKIIKYIEPLLKFIIIGLLGILLHFLYELTNESIYVSIISSINESIWEHMKIFFMSVIIMTIFELIIKLIVTNKQDIKDTSDKSKYNKINIRKVNYFNRFICTLIGVILIPILYYSYTGIFGENNDIVNISIFYIATLLFCVFDYKLSNNFNNTKSYKEYIGIVFIFFIFILFIVWTFMPPHIPIFQDPMSLTYGYSKISF